MDQPRYVPMMDRIRLIGYGLIAGLVVGAVLGWLFHAWIGFLFRIFILLLFLAPFIAALIFWRRVTSKPSPPRRVDVDVPDAEWVEIDANSRPRRGETLRGRR